MANAPRKHKYIEELLGITSRVFLYDLSPEDGRLAMLRNLHGTSPYLREHGDLIVMRGALMETRLVFSEMSASIADMLHEQLETPLSDMIHAAPCKTHADRGIHTPNVYAARLYAACEGNAHHGAVR